MTYRDRMYECATCGRNHLAGEMCPDAYQNSPDWCEKLYPVTYETPSDVFEQPGRKVEIHEGASIEAVPTNSQGSLENLDDVAEAMIGNVMHPPHYARWKMEPIEFIAINDLPWWLANIIKYTMRHDAKDGLQDLYKARSYLEMKIRQLEGVQRFWDKPVTDERRLNDVPKKAA